MKKLIFACITCTICMCANAQLYIDDSGFTILGDYTHYYEGVFNIFPKANQDWPILSHISTSYNSCVFEVINSPKLNSDYDYCTGISVNCVSRPNQINMGVMTNATGAYTNNSGRSYGVFSQAGLSTPGWNYGVCTSLYYGNNGAGLYASSGYNYDGLNVNGSWAGYFDGNVKVVGNMSATSYTTTSDYRLKHSIRQIDNGSLDKVMGMNVIRYRLKNPEVDLGDTAKTVHYAFPEDSPILKKDHFGLIAQELKEIYPELVDEGEDGYLSVNYMELVPILIKSIQELTSKVDALENEAAKSIQRGDKNTMTGGLNLQAILYQNDPNPFTENTAIKCVIPNGVRNAVLYIYDMNGHQIDSRTIAERGNTSLTIRGNSLDAGMYLYSLITDGTVVDTKRMILTK